MAKTIITQDGSAVNYDNILAVYIEENTYDGMESEMPSEEAASYLLSADTVTDVTYVLGEYKTAEETEKAKSELIADRKSTRLNSSHSAKSRMPSSA